MVKLKWVLALVTLFLAAACAEQKFAPTGSVPDTPENRKAAAQRYLEAMPPQEMLQNLVAGSVRRMPEPTRKKFEEAMAGKEVLEAATRITTEGLVKHFTADELNALATFYGSPAGKSARSKFGPYMTEIMPQINQEVRQVFAKIQEQAQPEGPKAGQPMPPKGMPMPPHPKADQPAAPKPGAVKPEAAKPEAKPEVPKPQPAKPEAAKPEPTKPEAAKPMAPPAATAKDK